MYSKAHLRQKSPHGFFHAVAATLLTLMAAGLCCHSVRADNKVLSKGEEIQLYDEAVHILGGNANVISRWTDTVRLAVIGAPNEQSDAKAQATVREIALQARLHWTLVTHNIYDANAYHGQLINSNDFELSACDSDNGDECANFIVLFASDDEIKRIAAALPLRPVYRKSLDASDSVLCFFAPFLTRGQVIRQAFVYVNRELSTHMLNTCLQEEIYQSFGLFNDSTDSKFFSFNNRVEPKSITEYDRALLASVYHPSLRPGSPVFAYR